MPNYGQKAYINSWVEMIHRWAHRQGFYDSEQCNHDPATPGDGPCLHYSGSLTAQLMLVVSELSEAVEALTKKDDENFREEIADAAIRLFDIAGACGIDLDQEIANMMSRNFSRSYRHGKEY